MHASAFDRFREGESVLHRLDPRVKVVATVLFIVSNTLLPDGIWWAFGLAFVLVWAANLLSELGPAYTLKRSFIALPFALAALSTVFSLPGEPVFSIGPTAWGLVATGPGLVHFASVVVRSWLSVQMAILLVAVTPFPDLLHALLHLRVPGVLVSVISFMYRYLFVLVDETIRLLRARQSRSARLPGYKSGGALSWRARVAGNMAGQLFLRSLDRSDRIYQAMLARGYTGHLLTLRPHQLTHQDWLAAGLVILLLAGLQIAARAFA